MTEKQPEALRLADALESCGCLADEATYDNAAAELRRLHKLNAEWEQKAATWLASPEAAQRLDGYRDLAQRLNTAELQRDEQLAALKSTTDLLQVWIDGSPPYDEAGTDREVLAQARAAIAKATGATQ